MKHNKSYLKNLQNDLHQLLGELQQKPDDMNDVRKLTQQLQQVVSDVEQLKQRLGAS